MRRPGGAYLITSLKSLRLGVFGHDPFLLFAADEPFVRHGTAAVSLRFEGDPGANLWKLLQKFQHGSVELVRDR